MNHKDRSLFHAYKDIESAASGVLNLPSTVIRDAKVMYKKFNGEKLTRGAVRTGVKANCVFMACKLAKIPRTTREIAEVSVRARSAHAQIVFDYKFTHSLTLIRKLDFAGFWYHIE